MQVLVAIGGQPLFDHFIDDFQFQAPLAPGGAESVPALASEPTAIADRLIDLSRKILNRIAGRNERQAELGSHFAENLSRGQFVECVFSLRVGNDLRLNGWTQNRSRFAR